MGTYARQFEIHPTLHKMKTLKRWYAVFENEKVADEESEQYFPNVSPNTKARAGPTGELGIRIGIPKSVPFTPKVALVSKNPFVPVNWPI